MKEREAGALIVLEKRPTHVRTVDALTDLT